MGAKDKPQVIEALASDETPVSGVKTNMLSGLKKVDIMSIFAIVAQGEQLIKPVVKQAKELFANTSPVVTAAVLALMVLWDFVKEADDHE